MRARLLFGILGASLLIAPLASAQQRSEGTFRVSAGTSITPDTVRIGDPFLVRVRIRAPLGATIDFPPVPDSTGTVQALDPRRDETSADSSVTELTAVYRLAAWDTGDQPVTLGDVVVHSGGAERTIPISGIHVFVSTVLPVDTTLRVPKPARDLFEFGKPLWWLWALLALVVVAIALGIWWWRRRRRRPGLSLAMDPFDHAQNEFRRVEGLGLLEAGERGRFVALMVEVLRDYLAARYTRASLSLTSRELSESLADENTIPHQRLASVLDEADLIKFARRPLGADRARDLAREIRGVVVAEHAEAERLERVERERAAAEAAASKARPEAAA